MMIGIMKASIVVTCRFAIIDNNIVAKDASSFGSCSSRRPVAIVTLVMLDRCRVVLQKDCLQGPFTITYGRMKRHVCFV